MIRNSSLLNTDNSCTTQIDQEIPHNLREKHQTCFLSGQKTSALISDLKRFLAAGKNKGPICSDGTGGREQPSPSSNFRDSFIETLECLCGSSLRTALRTLEDRTQSSSRPLGGTRGHGCDQGVDGRVADTVKLGNVCKSKHNVLNAFRCYVDENGFPQIPWIVSVKQTILFDQLVGATVMTNLSSH